MAYMLMEIGVKEDTRKEKHKGEALECNKTFFQAAKDLGLQPEFVHTDKDWAEISAVQVSSFPLTRNRSRFLLDANDWMFALRSAFE